MQIITWGINYSPELVGIAVYNTDLCEFLSHSGNQVAMVTSFPYYPGWRKRVEDAYKLYAKETKANVNVHRCWQYVPRMPTVFSRMLHEASFVLSSTFKLLQMPRADIYIVISPPLLLGMAAVFVSSVKRAPFIYHVQDLQPDAALRLGMLKPGWLVSMLFAVVRLTCRRAARVSTISKRMCKIIQSHGADPHKLLLWPNWVDSCQPADLPPAGAWKQRNGISSSRRIVSYAGNFGAKQGLDVVVRAAEVLQQTHPEVLFVMAGDGTEAASVRRLCAEQKLQNVFFQGVLSREDHTALLADSDVCVIPQKPGSSAAFLPSKLLKILSIGRPIVTNADCDSALHDAIIEGEFGISVQPGNADALARGIVDLLSDAKLADKFGEAGREYVKQFERIKVLSEFEHELQQIVAGLRRPSAQT